MTATDIRITLDRLNTFGDEVFGDQQVLQSYWYSIADIAVGARCKCNGHASKCDTRYGPDDKRERVCICEHNTAGPDCGKCLDFYNDAPWGRASQNHVHECKGKNIFIIIIITFNKTKKKIEFYEYIYLIHILFNVIFIESITFLTN